MAKIAFFDFCGTLVSFQTADAYVDFIRNNAGNRKMRFLDTMTELMSRLKVIAVFNRILPGNALYKKMKLFQLRYLPFEYLDRQAELYYRERIKPELLQPVLNEMKVLKADGYEICLVSAAYSIYLRYFADEYNIKHIISTEISFDRSGRRCLGRIKGTDCYGKEKVRKIRKNFKEGLLNISDSVSYSDNISDLPMLRFSGRAVVVSKEKSQRWSSDNNFRELIWI